MQGYKHARIRTKIVLGYLLVILCLGISILLVNDRIITLQEESESRTAHDRQVTELTNQMEKNLLDMETGQRGFVITDDIKYLEPFNAGKTAWRLNYNNLRQLTADDAYQNEQLESIEEHMENWIATIGDPVIAMKNQDQDDEVQASFASDLGKKQVDTLRSQFAAFRAYENELSNARIAEQAARNRELIITLYVIWFLVTFMSVAIGIVLSRSIVTTIQKVTDAIRGIVQSGESSKRIEVNTTDEVGDLARAANQLLEIHEHQSWIQQGIVEMTSLYTGVEDNRHLADLFLTKLAYRLNIPYGALYLRVEKGMDDRLVKVAAFAAGGGDVGKSEFCMGEGLVGQCAKEGEVLQFNQLPAGYIKIESGLGDAVPGSLLLAPVLYRDRVLAVIELAAIHAFSAVQEEYIRRVLETFGAALNSTSNSMEINRLYEEAQQFNIDLQNQSEEIQVQSEELQTVNEELAKQIALANLKSEEAERAKDNIESYARQLKISSNYKSEFLANMSHELRTPLNSMLILSQFLAENGKGTLSAEEQQYAQIIHSAGNDLLRLVSDILDLSKIEAGKMNIEIGPVNLTELPETLERIFAPQAKRKGLPLKIVHGKGLPEIVYSDGQRLQQIITNLLSNAVKFTSSGEVSLTVSKVNREEIGPLHLSSIATELLAFAVKDTGIGIPASKANMIFDAFNQGDGSIQRRFGGTGLGLSISRELAHLLGGGIGVESEEGVGSTFTLYVPCLLDAEEAERLMGVTEKAAADEGLSAHASAVSAVTAVSAGTDPLPKLEGHPLVEAEGNSGEESDLAGKRVLLVDDDMRNVYSLTQPLLHKGMEVFSVSSGKACIQFLKKTPDVDLILMDIMMPELNGYRTMEIIRQELGMTKVPIIAVTAKAMKQDREQCLKSGASDYISKPIHMQQLYSLIRVWLKRN